ncbi:hypothetical protein B0G84_8650 [Paraburkholderia sp. BL8N3]|nr:hypothetical protein B0G84_8650 [Paraburkholderia sp. BL8N3]
MPGRGLERLASQSGRAGVAARGKPLLWFVFEFLF